MNGPVKKIGSIKVNESGDLPELPLDAAEYIEWWEEARIVLNRQRESDQLNSEPSSISFDSATEWNHSHNLGRYPIVQALDTSGNLLSPTVAHTDTNNVKLTHSNATAGTLILY